MLARTSRLLLLPTFFAYSVTLRIAQHVGKDKASTVAPYIFCLSCAAGMFCMKPKSNWNTLVLQVVTPLMDVFSFKRRIWSFQYDWSELILVCAVSVVASLSLQQAYLIPWCQSVAYLFYGHDMPPTWVFSLYLTVSTLASLFAVWVSGKKSAQTNEPLFGEFHEDVVQMSLAFTGLCVGKAIGIPWNLTPLPVLAFLGLSVWITTRMVRA